MHHLLARVSDFCFILRSSSELLGVGMVMGFRRRKVWNRGLVLPGLWFCISLGLGGCVHSGGRAGAVEAPAGSSSVDIREAEDVGLSLHEELNELLLALASEDVVLAESARARAEVLARDLDAGVRLLTLLRSPRAGALARARARLPGLGALSEDGAVEGSQPVVRGDSWGGEVLSQWVESILRWELYGAVEVSSFSGMDCDAEALTPSSAAGAGVVVVPSAAFARCVLERVDAAFQASDARLSPTLRAAVGELAAVGRAWTIGRVLPVDDRGVVGDEDASLRSSLAWTGLSEDEGHVATPRVFIVLRSTGVWVSQRPAVSGASIFEEGGQACAWPGERVLSFSGLTGVPSLSEWSSALEGMESALSSCERSSSGGARVSLPFVVDAGVRWSRVQPVVRRAVALRRAPVFIARSAGAGQLSLLPVEAVASVRGDRCGVEAHLRSDGVVLRGGGASTSLLSWAESGVFSRLSDAGREVASRCGSSGVARVYVDDANVDWGVVVRVLERLSWPQVCASGPCLQTWFVVGEES